MDRPPHSPPGSATANQAGSVSDRPNTPSSDAADPSTLATLPALAFSAGSPKLNTPSLAGLAQRYDILAEAGHGAMGQVYKARDRETGETVALKLLKPEIASDQAMVERFKSELLFARKITHKNVCRVYEFNRIDGIACTSMEFIEGENLRSVLNRFGSLTLRKGVDLALQMCSGLKEAHAQGIVHRDLKPENVMIDAQGNLKIMDFGIARSMETMSRLTGAMTGTPAYMAPEQAAGKPVDYRTDIYALGLMLYEMFTGTQAFRADSAVAVALKQMHESPMLPRAIEPSIPVSIERAIMRCIEKEPDQRFQSISELEAVLRSAATSAPCPTASPSGEPVNDKAVREPDGIAISVHAPSPEPKSKRAFAILGLLLLGAVAALGVLAGWRILTTRNISARSLPPQRSLPAPPESPLKSVPPSGGRAASGAVKTPPPPNSKKNQAPRSPTAAAVLAPSAAAVGHPETPSPQAAAQPAGRARTGQVSAALPSGALQATTPAGAAGAQVGPSYVFVGRFPRAVGAQSAAKQIEGMSLPVTVIPRHNPKNNIDFFAVFCGPFGAKKIDSVTAQLHARGFTNARPVRGLGPVPPPSSPVK